MDIDNDLMEAEFPSYKCFLDVPHLFINQEVVMDLNRDSQIPPSSDAKVIKIISYEKLFAFIEQIEVQNFPFLFVLVIYEPQITQELIDKIQNDVKSKFKDDRPVVVEIRTNSGSVVYYKEENNFFDLSDLMISSNKNVSDLNQMFQLLNEPQEINVDNLIGNILNLKNEVCLRILKVFTIDLNVEVEICKCIAKNSIQFDFMLHKLFYAALDLPFDFIQHFKVSEKSKQLIRFISPNYESILRTVVENNVINLVSFVVNNFKSTLNEMSFDCKQRVAQVAFDNAVHFPDIFLFLIDADFPFPLNFNKAIFKNSYNKILSRREELHDAIIRGDKNIVEELIGNSKIAYNFSNNSAIYVALVNKKFEIYSLLDRAYGFKSCVRENFDEIINQLSDLEKDAIYSFNISNAKRDDIKLEEILTSKSILLDQGRYHDLNLNWEHRKKIQNFFTCISKIPKLLSVLKIAAHSPTFEIHFDFFAQYVHRMHPKYPNTLGLAIPIGVILIGAMGHEGNELVVMGTIIHELMHYAVQVVYENNFEPFYVGDERRRTEIQGIVDDYRTKVDVSDQIVSNVYSYPVDQWILELIVRVPEMMVRFNENKIKLAECMESKNYYSLFQFCDGVFEDIDKFNAEKRRKIRELNKTFGYTIKPCMSFVNSGIVIQDYSQLIVAEIPELTMSAVIQEVKKLYGTLFDGCFLFINVKELHGFNADVHQEFISALNDNSNLNVVVDFTVPIDASKLQLLNGYLTAEHLARRKFTIIASVETAELFKGFTQLTSDATVSHCWSDLTDDSQREILLKSIKFQNERIKLSDVVELKNSASLFNLGFLPHCFSKEILTVNEIKPLQDIYMVRKISKKCKTYEEPKEVDEQEYITRTQILKENIETLKFDEVKKTYEIRKILDENYDLDEKNLIDDEKDLKYVLISDTAGSGKSRFLVKVRDYLSVKYPLSWVQKVDLKMFIKEFKTIEDDVNFLEFFKTYLMKGFKDYEKILFEFFFNHHKIFILFDGFDEISPKCVKEVLVLIKSFNAAHGSQLWITTRLHLEIDLKNELIYKNEKVDVTYSLKPLTMPQQIEFFIEYWTRLNITADLHDKASSLVDRLSNITKSNNSSPIGLPQLLIIIAENSINEAGGLDEDLLENLYRIYEKSIGRLFRLWNRERGDLALETHENAEANDTSFNIIHKFVSLKSYFVDKVEFCGTERNKEVWTDVEIIRCGIVESFINNSPMFKHETYKESFCSIFIIQGFTSKSENWKYWDEFLIYFLSFMIEDEFEVIRMFIDDGLKDIEIAPEVVQNFGKVLAKKLETTKINMKTQTTSRLSLQNDFEILLNAVREGKEHLLNFLLAIVRTLGDEMIKNILLQRFKDHTILTTEFKHFSSFNFESFKQIFSFCKETLKKNDFEDFVLSKDAEDDCIFHLALSVSEFPQILTFLTENCSDCIKIMLTSRDAFYRSPLFNLKPSDFNPYWNCLCKNLSSEEIVREMFAIDRFGLNVFHHCSMKGNADLLKFLFTKLKELDASKLKEIFEIRCENERFKNRNFLELATYAKNLNFHDLMWNCLMEVYVDKEDVLTEFILTRDDKKNNFLNILVTFSSIEVIEFTLNFIKKKFTNHREIFESKGFKGRNLLMKAADLAGNNAGNQMVSWDFLHEIYADSFFETFLKPVDDQGDNLIHAVVAYSTKAVLECVLDFMDEPLKFTDEDIKFYLQSKGYSKCNLLQRAAILNQSKDLHEFLWLIFKKYFPKNLKEFIEYRNSYGSNLMHVVTAFNSFEICELTWSKIRELVYPDVKDQENYLKVKGFRQRSLLENCQNRSKNQKGRRVIEWVENLTKSHEFHDEISAKKPCLMSINNNY